MTKTLKAQLTAGAVLAPGVYDALTALLAERAGFSAAYLSGASLAYTQLGLPDIGLVSFDHLADVVARICERISIPLIVDADTGFGNALNVIRTVKVLERMGAAALQLEDQAAPKRCGHLAGKSLIDAAEMVGKIKAAADARASAETLIIARTDAIAVEGFEAALARAETYLEAGADVIFVEAPQNEAQLRAVATTFSGRVPLVANMVEGGKTPLHPVGELEALGFRLVICPGAVVRAVIPAVEGLLASLAANGATSAFADRMIDITGVNERIGLDRTIAVGQRYSPAIKTASDRN